MAVAITGRRMVTAGKVCRVAVAQRRHHHHHHLPRRFSVQDFTMASASLTRALRRAGVTRRQGVVHMRQALAVLTMATALGGVVLPVVARRRRAGVGAVAQVVHRVVPQAVPSASKAVPMAGWRTTITFAACTALARSRGTATWQTKRKDGQIA